MSSHPVAAFHGTEQKVSAENSPNSSLQFSQSNYLLFLLHFDALSLSSLNFLSREDVLLRINSGKVPALACFCLPAVLTLPLRLLSLQFWTCPL